MDTDSFGLQATYSTDGTYGYFLADKMQQQLTDLENSRPVFKNPYENMTNQFENLPVPPSHGIPLT
eukprot:SAG31_NODE_44394_length_263_cov_0.621951_1_plen_65_part_10